MSGFSATGAILGLWLRKSGLQNEILLAMPIASFDVRESLEFTHDTRRYLLTPIELKETGNNFKIGRYREQIMD